MPLLEEVRVPEVVDKELPIKEDRPRWRQTFAELAKTWIQTMVITASLFFLITHFAVQGYAVSGSCMEPNLRTGERVLGNKIVYRLDPPNRGDVIVFEYPLDPKKTYIKRIIGLPGETIEVRAGRVFINNKPLREPYLINVAHGNYGPEKVKPGRLFVMGDYRDQSNDSRLWGELPISHIRAKAWVRYWPVKRVELMK